MVGTVYRGSKRSDNLGRRTVVDPTVKIWKLLLSENITFLHCSAVQCKYFFANTSCFVFILSVSEVFWQVYDLEDPTLFEDDAGLYRSSHVAVTPFGDLAVPRLSNEGSSAVLVLWWCQYVERFSSSTKLMLWNCVARKIFGCSQQPHDGCLPSSTPFIDDLNGHAFLPPRKDASFLFVTAIFSRHDDAFLPSSKDASFLFITGIFSRHDVLTSLSILNHFHNYLMTANSVPLWFSTASLYIFICPFF